MSRAAAGLLLVMAWVGWGPVDGASAVAEEEEEPGKTAYLRVCGDCHGSEGQGDIAPPIVPLGYDADYVLLMVREGYVQMPPISEREISDEEVQQVVVFLEALGAQQTDAEPE